MYLPIVDYRLLKGRGSFSWSCSTKLGSRMEVRLSLQKTRHLESLLCISILGAWHQQVATKHWLICDRRRCNIGFFSNSIFTSFKSVVIYAKKKTLRSELIVSDFILHICCVGCKGVVTCWFCQLDDMALCISYTCPQLEEQALRGSKLGHHIIIWQRQQQDRLKFHCKQNQLLFFPRYFG